jgi:hypothetical protein
MSVSVPSSSEISNTLGFVSLCRYTSLLNYDIFIQPGTPSNWSNCQMHNNNENWNYFVSDILIYLGKSLKIISLFPQNLGVQRHPFFVLGASQDALLAKSQTLTIIRNKIFLLSLFPQKKFPPLGECGSFQKQPNWHYEWVKKYYSVMFSQISLWQNEYLKKILP